MSFYNHITTVEIAERGALSAMPIGTAADRPNVVTRLAEQQAYRESNVRVGAPFNYTAYRGLSNLQSHLATQAAE